MTKHLIELSELEIDLRKQHTTTSLVKHINFTLPKGAIMGIVGESGSGKSLVMKSMMNHLPDGLSSQFKTYTFDGKPVDKKTKLPISMIFQDPMTALDPVRTIGFHLVEIIQRFQNIRGKQAKQLAIAELEKVGIANPQTRFRQFPHELSGGMRQRVLIAMALLAKPDLLIADEPTTALDVTIQAQILKLIRALNQKEKLTVILVSHDFGVVAGMCDFIQVMYQGRIVETGSAEDIFYNPAHTYTKQLLASAKLGDKHDALPVFNYQATLAEDLILHQLSPTHSVWLEKGGSDVRINTRLKTF